jgi:hypothetical protein
MGGGHSHESTQGGYAPLAGGDFDDLGRAETSLLFLLPPLPSPTFVFLAGDGEKTENVWWDVGCPGVPLSRGGCAKLDTVVGSRPGGCHARQYHTPLDTPARA